ncbi:hypothetical protein [Aquabacterium parvum]|uniref:hypothetical protein n=1 Tax=Aquabacterium parvum TaxID=70584 RepID=UPI000718B7F8|nr:hypothetical protein [Aquabacterium parvum]MBU0916912.1 hypothetical protein [Gammaproteobacteria bacterium]
MPHPHQVIHIHPEAPPKPPEGAPCNGCGVCCLAEPCPVGMLVSRKRRGACDLLRWSDAQGRYVCGLLADGDASAGAQAGGARSRSLWRRLWQAWARRLISAGSGCDASIEVGAAGESCQK